MCQKQECCNGSENKIQNDRLGTMWAMQKELNKRCGLDSDTIKEALAEAAEPGDEIGWARRTSATDKQKEWLGKLHIATAQELAELRDSIPWKWWKAQTFDPQNAKVEVVDMFHFIMSMAQVLGMTEDDFFQAYMKKNAVNHKRQDGDYKTNPNAVGGESDCRHI